VEFEIRIANQLALVPSAVLPDVLDVAVGVHVLEAESGPINVLHKLSFVV
jgi:hypothetical protein